MFNPITASQEIKDAFTDYITTTFDFADPDYADELKKSIQESGAVAKGPYLEVSGSYESGESIAELIAEHKVSPLFDTLENCAEKDKELKIQRGLYLHQIAALEKANARKNLVVTTGTGSGKTECFLIPVIDSLLKEEEAGTLNDAVRAIIIYPMNALANDQIKRHAKLLKDHLQFVLDFIMAILSKPKTVRWRSISVSTAGMHILYPTKLFAAMRCKQILRTY